MVIYDQFNVVILSVLQCQNRFFNLYFVLNLQLASYFPDLLVIILFHCHRNIKNAVIGNKAKKSSFIRLNVIPKVIELLVQDDTGIEFVVESVVLLGSLARGVVKTVC